MLALHEAQRPGPDQLQLQDGRIADAFDLLQSLGGRVDDLGEGAEALPAAAWRVGLVSRRGMALNSSSSSSS